MAKTFTDINDRVIEIVEGDTQVYTNEDIVTGNPSNYIIEVEGNTYEVDKKVYDAVERYL